MNPYEITCIVRPDLDEEQTQAVVRQVVGRIQSAGGEIIASYPWSPSRRRMAYPIKDYGDGYYFTVTFKLGPGEVREFENALKLFDNVLRFLVVQATDLMIKQSEQRQQQATAAAAQPQPSPAPYGGAPQQPPAAPAAPAAPAQTVQAIPVPAAPAVPEAGESTPVASGVGGQPAPESEE